MSAQALFDFIKSSPTAYHTIESVKRALVENGFCELCEGEEDALGYIEEIGAKRGYAKSRFTVSEKTYKVKKRAVKLNILRRLYLLDAERTAVGEEPN